MSAELLASVLAIVMSLAFSYIPGLSDWYTALDRKYKQVVMGVGLVVIAFSVFGLACAGFGAQFGIDLACTQDGAIALLKLLIDALIVNQGTYLLTRK